MGIRGSLSQVNMTNTFDSKASGIVQKKIGDATYTLKLLPVLPQLVTFTKLITICAPVLTAIQDKVISDQNAEAFFIATGQESLQNDINFTYIATVLATQVDKLDVVALIDNLLKNLYRGNEPIDLLKDSDENAIELLVWALTENFATSFLKLAKDKGMTTDFLQEFLPKGLLKEG